MIAPFNVEILAAITSLSNKFGEGTAVWWQLLDSLGTLLLYNSGIWPTSSILSLSPDVMLSYYQTRQGFLVGYRVIIATLVSRVFEFAVL